MLNSMTIEAAKSRAAFFALIRDFFVKKGYLEVDVPVLGSEVSWDAHIDPFEINMNNAPPLFLQTSPELYLKRLLAKGYPNLFCFSKAFRKGEVGNKHQSEFTMLEWYQRDASLQNVIEETKELLGLYIKPRHVKEFTFEELFIDFYGIHPLHSSLPELDTCCKKIGLSLSGGITRDLAIDFLFDHIESQFTPDNLVIVKHFPAYQSSMAQVCEGGEYAERFEIFINGVELGNGYLELQTPIEHESRISSQNRIRNDANKKSIPKPEFFLKDISPKLPKCSGMSLGLDRILMIKLKAQSLEEVMPFASAS